MLSVIQVHCSYISHSCIFQPCEIKQALCSLRFPLLAHHLLKRRNLVRQEAYARGSMRAEAGGGLHTHAGIVRYGRDTL